MQKKVLITGAFGFVGSNLAAYLACQGYELWALDVGDTAKLLETSGDSRGVYERVFNWEQLEEIPWCEVGAVVHLAGKAHDTKSTSDPQSYFEVNVGLTKRVLEAFRECSAACAAFILFSSVKAVADSVAGVLTEEVEPQPQTAYGLSKLEAEGLLQPQSGCNKVGSQMRTYVLRPCMIHGPGNKGNLNLLYSAVSKGVPWPLGAFENERSFASIGNVCAVVEGLISGEVESGTYQVADDEALSTNELIRMIAESQGRRLRLWRMSPGAIAWMARVGDWLHLPLNSERLKKLTESYVVSNAKVKRALGWERMPVGAKEGMRQTLESFSR